MSKSAALIESLKSDPLRMECLRLVRDLNLQDCWIAAGFIRNFIWDQLNQIPLPAVKSDIDVIYFDPQDTRQKSEKAIENELEAKLPTASQLLGEWSVKNQARMHLVNRDRPYRNCEDALKHWPETVTAIAARINRNDEIELLAPFSLDDLYNQIIRPCPHFEQHKLFEFKVRQDKKCWKERWPNLQQKIS